MNKSKIFIVTCLLTILSPNTITSFRIISKPKSDLEIYREREVWMILDPLESTDSSVAVKCFNILEVLFGQVKIGAI